VRTCSERAGGKLPNTVDYLGHFADPFTIPEVIRRLDCLHLGSAAASTPEATTKVYGGYMVRQGKESQADEALIGGRRCWLRSTDSPARVQVAEKKAGVHAFGWDSDMSSIGPNEQLDGATGKLGGLLHRSSTRKGLAAMDRSTADGQTCIKENDVVGRRSQSPFRPTWRGVRRKKNGHAATDDSSFAGTIRDNNGCGTGGQGNGVTQEHEQLMAINFQLVRDGVERARPK